MEKKRKYIEEYINLGFTTLLTDGVEQPQCVLCHVVLSAESLKPSILKRHLEAKHPQHAKKDAAFFKRHEAGLKRQRLDAAGNFHQKNVAVLQASYEVALEIAKGKKPHTIGETLVKPRLLKTVKLVLDDASAAKVKQISLSNNTIKRRISDMAKGVTVQVVQEIKGSPMFSFQLDETTDVSLCAQLLVFVRYIHSGDFKEEFLFCSELDSTTKSADVMKKMTTFLNLPNLNGQMFVEFVPMAPLLCWDRSLAFKNKFRSWHLKQRARTVSFIFHRYALASKTLPAQLKDVLNSVVKIVNFIQAGGLSSRQFKQLCKDMNSTHETLLFHTAIRWLSKGNVLNRVYEMKDEI